MPHTLGTQEEVNNIIKTYTKLYEIIFSYWKYILTWIVTIIVFSNIILQPSQTNNFLRNNTIKEEENKLTTKYQEIINIEQENPDIKLYINQWPLTYSDKELISSNNYIIFRGFVLPKEFSINKNIQLRDYSYFSDPNYDMKELELYLDNFIYNSKKTDPTLLFNNPTLKIPDNSLIDYFSLWCTNGFLISNKVCNKLLQEFLDSFYVYDLEQNYTQLLTLFNSLKQDQTIKTRLCDQTLLHTQYSNSDNKAILPLMRECWDEYKNQFNAFSTFSSIQEQLNNTNFNTDISDDKLLNTYKLVSAQQSIFSSLQNKKLNLTQISSYITYVDELLRKWWVDSFYFDVTYIFNNTYLEKNLIKNFFNLQWEDTESSKQILANLRNLNTNNDLVWYKWLEKQISNQVVLLQKDKIKEVEFIEEPLDSSIDYFNKTYSFNNFTISNTESIDPTTIKINWNFRYLAVANIPDKIDATLTVTEINWAFIVKSFKTDNELLNKYINTNISNNNQTIPDIHRIIQSDRAIINEGVQAINTCDKLTSTTTFNKNAVLECNSTFITIKTTHPRLKQEVTYSIRHSAWVIQKIESSDPQLVAIINSNLQPDKININTFVDFVIQLYNFKTDDPSNRQIDYWQWSNDKIYIETTIKQYLWESSQNILEKDNSYLVDITLQEIQYLIWYNIKNDTLWPLLIHQWGQNYIFSTFSLKLSSDNINQVEDFSRNPIEYLKKIDPLLINKREKAKK